MAKSPEQIASSMISNLKDKTGRPLDEWLKVLSKAKLVKHGEIVKHLKAEYAVTHGYANFIAHQFLMRDVTPPDDEDLITAQYSGGKAHLRPIYDALVQAVQRFGSDIEVSPKKAYVSLRRTKQFAIIQPSTRTRVDVGINCKGLHPTERLEPSGSFGSMVSLRVRVIKTKDVDDQLIDWLRQAYARA